MGMRGKVEGKTKEECRKEILRADRDARKVFMTRDYPPNKAGAFKQMKQNERTGLWIVDVRHDN